MNPKEAKQYLDSFIDFEQILDQTSRADFKLDRVLYLLDHLDNPHKKIKCIHVAGTKGKGSTCAYVAYILKNANFRVGLYTSPHLNDVKERIRVLDPGKKSHEPFAGQINDNNFCRLIEKIKTVIDSESFDQHFKDLTYFETLTSLAFCYFSEREVGFAILETGLGGRLDATNVVDALVCGITPVGFEHSKILGSTLSKIAKEKIAIVKNKNQRVVIAPQKEEALKTIRTHLKKVRAKSLVVGQDITWQSVQQDTEGQTYNIKGAMHAYKNLRTHLLGTFQAVNICMAVGIIESLERFGFSIDQKAVYKGIEQTIWPGRFEIARKKPFVVLDCAHTVEACRYLTESIRKVFPNKNVSLILGVSKDKDIRGICKELNRVASSVILTKSNHPRAYDFRQSKQTDLFNKKDVMFADNTKEAISVALNRAQSNDVILVSGSLFVVGEAQKLCTNQT